MRMELSLFRSICRCVTKKHNMNFTFIGRRRGRRIGGKLEGGGRRGKE
jgi:hypothetical protein